MRRVVGRHGALTLSIGLSVGGWGLMWAQSLAILRVGPIWLPVAAFVIGLALIPAAIPRQAGGGVPASREQDRSAPASGASSPGPPL